jgi:hypothetical protein
VYALAVGKIWRMSWKGHYDAGPSIVSSLHFVTQPAALLSDASADAVLDVLNTALTGAYLDMLPTAYVLDIAEVSEILSPTDLTTVPDGAVITPDDPGTLAFADEKLPFGLTMIVSIRTGVARRWARGYMAVPSPLNSGYLDDGGQWQGEFLSVCSAFADLLDDDYETGFGDSNSIIPVIYSRTRHVDPDLTPWAQVQGAVARTTPSWRRSRMTTP